MDEESRYHTLLRDPARRKIIEVLAVRWKKKTINIVGV